jgi:hypothetical protein
MGVAVEKLTHQKTAEETLRLEALQTTVSVFLDIFCPPNFRRLEKNGLFQQPRDLSTMMRAYTLKYGP